jgi:DNA-binding transcriptional ArsR family regulator
MRIDPDVPAIAKLLGDRARLAMLFALQDGTSRPAGELARVGAVSASTASEHLARLVEGGLLSVVRQGRHRYFRLVDDVLPQVIELLCRLARPALALTGHHQAEARELRFARTCYGHLAGWLGVAVTDALCARGLVARRDLAFEITDRGRRWFTELGAPTGAHGRACLDWSERRHHLAGPAGTTLARRMLDEGWLVRARQGRAVRVSDRGRRWLRAELGLEVPVPAQAVLASTGSRR